MKIGEFIKNFKTAKSHKINLVIKLWKDRVSLINVNKSHINNSEIITRINEIKAPKRNQIIREYLHLIKLNYHQSCKSLKIYSYYSTLNKNASSTYLTDINLNVNISKIKDKKNNKIHRLHRLPRRNYSEFNWIPSERDLDIMILKAAGYFKENEECPELILLEQSLRKSFR